MKKLATVAILLTQITMIQPQSTSQQPSNPEKKTSRSELTSIILPYVASELAANGVNGLYHYARYVAFAPWVYDKFYVVDQGKFYRSAQLKQDPPFWYRGKTFEYYVDKYGIKLSINLRSDLDNNPAWTAQKQIVTAHNEKFPHTPIGLINIPLNSRQLPFPEAVAELLELYANKNNYPIHINCIFGSDRTSLASALYVFEHMNQDKSIEYRLEKALEQFNFIKYGHIEPHMPNMKKFIRTWAEIRSKYTDINDAIAMYAHWYMQQPQ